MLVPELRSDPSNKPDGTVPRFPAHDARLVGSQGTPTTTLTARSGTSWAKAIPATTSFSRTRAPQCWSQGDQEVLRTDMANAAALDELIRRFLNYETTTDPGVSGREAAVSNLTCRPCWRAFAKPS